MAIQYANLTYSYAVDNYVDLPTGAPPGQLAYVVSTAKAYYSTNGTWKEVLLAGAGGFQPYTYSFDNPPASPSAYDDEFDATTLNAKWTATSGGTTNPVIAGTVNPIASLTTPVYDLSTQPSMLLVQSDNSSNAYIEFRQTITIATNATFICKILGNNTPVNADETNLYYTLRNSADTNEWVYFMLRSNGGSRSLRLSVNNNGAITNISGNSMVDRRDALDFYLIIWKLGDVYHAGYAWSPRGGITYFGSVTKTGVTTFDNVTLDMNTANETPSRILGFDFFRYYPSITYALMN